MNRILPIQGTVTARGDTQMAEANQSQQQRFEQAMRLEQSLKERGHNPQPEVRHSQRVTDVHPLPQQNLHRAPSEAGKQVSLRHTTKGTQPDNKEITAKQQRQGCEQTNPQQVIFTPPNRHQSQCLTDNPERVAATIAPINAITLTLDKTRTSSQQTKHTQFTAQDNDQRPPILTITANPVALRPTNTSSDVISTHLNESLPLTEGVGSKLTAQPESMQSAPKTSLLESSADLRLTAIITQPYGHVTQATLTENEWLDEQHPVIEAHKAANANAIDVITNTTPHLLPLATDNEAIPPKLASSLRTDIGELAAQLDAEIQQLTAIKPVTTGETAPKGELFANPAIWVAPLAVTPGDLQLARLAPAESNRELCQLLERLAVDIYQELGRPERPPLLRLTLPQLGDLSIRIAHHNGELQIEILATAQGELLLNQGRSDLVDRLQRLYPGERVALDLFNQADSERGSRHKRSIYEEWDADA
ncbi:type III secretion system needle length determinant [Aeromonas salmonicida]|uniref:type III secretion system needle length determinant n=1 Tax=Aeromonas salmonicida TaxID=645 RepID=UPI001F4EBAAE|nr:type III secretion system needle length determinant [Aeromonas salmonicida]